MRLLGPDEHRLPMVFQYNPLETYLETTADGELLCTINSTAVLTPKLRYGIGDLRLFFDGDLRWLRHYGFSALDVPTLSGGVGA